MIAGRREHDDLAGGGFGMAARLGPGPAHAAELSELLAQHAAGSGIAYSWEQQLPNTRVPSAAG
jgi:hypothetical protein